MKGTLGALAPLLLLAACAGLAPGKGAATFDFGVIGDMPYTRAQEAEYARVIEDLNARSLEFVAHVGDMMFDPRPYERNPALARMPATDENYAYVLGTFQTIRRRATVRVIPDSQGYLIDVMVEKDIEDLPHPENSTAGAATFRNDSSIVAEYDQPVSPVRLAGNWILLGRDPALEQRILADIQARLSPQPAPQFISP